MHISLIALFLLPLVSDSPTRAEDPQPRERLLFLTHSVGYEHAVIKRASPDELSIAERCLVEAAGDRYEVVATKDCSLINAKSLATFDAVLFYTTGELPIAKPQLAEFIDWIADGGAFVGIHCATDTLYEYEPYVEMIGGSFDGHPWHEEVSLTVADGKHPATKHLDATWEIKDEIYQFKSQRGSLLHGLLSLSGTKADLSKGKREDAEYLTAWCRPFGAGRVFYTALGHREEVWEDETFRAHLLAGVEWSIHGPDLPMPPQSEAERLMESGDLSAWQHTGGHASEWEMSADEATVVAGSGNLRTKSSYGDALIHVEFSPSIEPPDVKGQGRGNSGVYLMGAYELQVLDSFGREAEMGDCGACYGVALPLETPYRRAGEWSYYDIELRAPRFDSGGAKTENARITAWLNGRLIHDDLEIPGPTGGSLREGEFATGPLMLQEHGNRVRFRNVWVASR